MGARDFADLEAWQLSKVLQRRVLELIDRSSASRNFKLRDQIDDAVSSAPRNIAEGFGRFEAKEFAHFLKVAVGSLFETRNHLIDACERGLITDAERHECDILARRAIAATTSLRNYLLSDRNQVSNKRTFKPPQKP